MSKALLPCPGIGRVSRWPALLVCVLLLASGAAHAQWKWRDKDGRVTVSDRPPPKDVAEKDILSKPAAARRAALPPSVPASGASAPAPAEGGRTPLEREVEARRKAQEQEQSTKAKAEEAKLAAQRAESCQRARSHLGALESGQRIARLNEKGEREVLDDKGRAEESRQARETIGTDCK
jgi:Domain of unknown function (DUF4124)